MYYQQLPGQVPPPPPPPLPPHQQPEMALQYHQYNNYQQPPPAPPAPPQPGNVLFGYQQVAPPQQPGSTVQQIPANTPPTLDQTQPLLYTPIRVPTTAVSSTTTTTITTTTTTTNITWNSKS